MSGSGAVVVTGGAGFIGSHLVDALLADGHRVTVIDDLSSGDADRVDPGAELERIDITDRSALDRAMDVVRPDAVFHLAAQSSVTVSVSDPHRDCAVNVNGTLTVLEAAERHGAPVVLSSTGGALYGNAAPLPTPEEFTPAPISPYGASKWAGEAYVRTWGQASGIPHAVCRLGNVYGPRQSPHGEAGVVAIFSYALWRGEQPVLFGHGQPSRDYVHVADVVAALRAASGRGGVYNVSTGIATPVSEIFERLQGEAGTSVEPRLAPLRDGELEISRMDPSRAAKELGWRARTGLAEGLRDTYQALVGHFERAAARAG